VRGRGAAILVPLVVSTTDHQRFNAEFLASRGAALHEPQERFEPEALARLLGSLTRAQILAVAQRARSLGHPDATAAVAAAIESLADGSSSSIGWGSARGPAQPLAADHETRDPPNPLRRDRRLRHERYRRGAAESRYVVSGSDVAESPATRHLSRLGVRIAVGHDAVHVQGADVVVVSSAVRPTIPKCLRRAPTGFRSCRAR